MKEQVVLVTGGAGNLGQVVSRAFLDVGAPVAVPVYKTDHVAALDQLKNDFGSNLHSFLLDLTTERGAEQAVRQVVEWGGSLTSVIHLVGGYSGGSRIADTSLGVWARMVDLNMTSAYLVARFSIPRLIAAGGGTFVFVSSRAAVEARAERGAYASSKAGLIVLAQTIAEEYGPEGIRSNVLVPDTIATDENRRTMPYADTSGWISTDSVASAALFLASADSRAINGAAIPVYNAV